MNIQSILGSTGNLKGTQNEAMKSSKCWKIILGLKKQALELSLDMKEVWRNLHKKTILVKASFDCRLCYFPFLQFTISGPDFLSFSRENLDRK